MGCAKPELTVWSEYPEFSVLFIGAGESGLPGASPLADFKKITVNYRAPSKETDFSGDLSILAPGLFILDGVSLGSFIETGLALDVAEIPELPEVPAPEEAASQNRPLYYRNGQGYGFFLNSGTGLLCYDPELMQRYMGISDPVPVQEQLGDLNSFIVAAFLISDRSFGSCAVLPETSQLRPAFQHTKSLSLQEAGLSEAEAEKWFTDIRGIFQDRRWEGLTFENGSPRRTVTFFLPPNSAFSAPGETKVNWQLIPGPDPENNGGIWLVLHRDLFAGKRGTVRKIREYLGLVLRQIP
jgi:hypothetical protein